MMTLPSRISNEFRNLLRHDPVSGLREEMDELINRFAMDWNGNGLSDLQLPSTDISESDNHIEVKIDVPGLKPEDIKIEVRGNFLEISGQHEEKKEEKDKTFHRIERRTGAIRRALTLPAEVDETKTVAECRNGVLTITLPKKEASKTHHIAVKG